MKVKVNIVLHSVIIIAIIGFGWYAYERNAAFHALVDDVIGYAGLREGQDQQQPATADEAVTVATAPETAPAPQDTEGTAAEEQVFATEPSVTEPPATEPSVTEPSVTDLAEQPASPMVIPEQQETPQETPQPADVVTQEIAQPQPEQAIIEVPAPSAAPTAVTPEAETPEALQPEETVKDGKLTEEPATEPMPVGPASVEPDMPSADTPPPPPADTDPLAVAEEPMRVADEHDVGSTPQPVKPWINPDTLKPDRAEADTETTEPVPAESLQAADIPATEASPEAMPVTPPAASAWVNPDQSPSPPEAMAGVEPGPDQGLAQPPSATVSELESAENTALMNARRAWQEKRHEQAIHLYQEMMQQFPDNPDAAGELGNIYFSRGETDEAVNVYAEAMQRLLRAGDVRRAWGVLTIIRQLAPERAQALEGAFSGAAT